MVNGRRIGDRGGNLDWRQADYQHAGFQHRLHCQLFRY